MLRLSLHKPFVGIEFKEQRHINIQQTYFGR